MTTTPIKFIYFDVGGVLLEFAHIRSDIPREWGIDPADFQACLAEHADAMNRGTIASSEIEAALIKRFGDKVPVGYWASGQFVERFRPIVPMHAFVQELAPRYRLGLLTNVGTTVYTRTAADFSYLYPPVSFEIRVASCEEGVAKPEPEIYRRAIARTGLLAEQILFIDDLPENIVTARGLGMQAMEFETAAPAKMVTKLRQLLLS